MSSTLHRLLDIALWLVVGVRRMHDDADNVVVVARLDESELERSAKGQVTNARRPWFLSTICLGIGVSLVVASAAVEMTKGTLDALSLAYLSLSAVGIRLITVRGTCNRLPPRYLRASLLAIGKCPACAYPLSPAEAKSLTRCTECGAQWYFTIADPEWAGGHGTAHPGLGRRGTTRPS